MCRAVGIECEEVAGHSKGIGYRQGQSYRDTDSAHMWNAVRLGGHWYLLDACWGAGRVDLDNKAFIKRYDDFYFLPDPEDFIDSHRPDEQQWQLLDPPVPLEEFEKRVFKTSAFYRLGLQLLHPKHFLMVTEGGEATVSIALSRPVEFSYQISQGGGGSVSSSFGLLTVTRVDMTLRLLPPARGRYEVTVFARPPGPTGTFGWVCSFQLDCPEPSPSHEELPENPFLSWGLQPAAPGLGVTQSSHGAEAAATTSGSFRLVLQTSRPLAALCELTHRRLDGPLSKRCLATQIEPRRLTCHALCPFPGLYRLSVFVRDYDPSGDGFRNAGNFLLRCAAGALGLGELFPSSLSSACGPGVRTERAGLSRFSHTGALVSTRQGGCNITFHSAGELDLHAVLARDQGDPPDRPLSRHVLLTQTDRKVTLSVALPEPGVYRLGLYGKRAAGHAFDPLCDFVLSGSAAAGLPPFPCTYAAWRKGCVLFEPRSGRLRPHAWVRFRVRVPGVQSVSAVVEEGEGGRTPLQLNNSRVWEGDVLTGSAASQLKLAAGGGGEGADMAVIMSFDVVDLL
ncbi:hypothetical protein AAFF_G00290220 [Aldrovandia affinis]|uniref:KY-like immunoglobulin-like domain-containing protein n=1 Tax=Aldrovandia affinis TaxID=143900 RepID=A0AAD7R9F7_9TELE|nr:hypothetical protein AAFF_G00290220 [Aldrovandia affinis]